MMYGHIFEPFSVDLRLTFAPDHTQRFAAPERHGDDIARMQGHVARSEVIEAMIYRRGQQYFEL